MRIPTHALGAICILAALQGCGDSSATTPVNTPREELRFTTLADGTRGNKGGVDTGAAGPSQGDMFVFDQPLMDAERKDIGSNSGYCVSTKVGASSQCQWTLTFSDGALVVAGQEAEAGTSVVAVIGATGRYSGFTGEMTSFPNGDGTFTQELRLHRP